jgi:hypothetical protein
MRQLPWRLQRRHHGGAGSDQTYPKVMVVQKDVGDLFSCSSCVAASTLVFLVLLPRAHYGDVPRKDGRRPKTGTCYIHDDDDILLRKVSFGTACEMPSIDLVSPLYCFVSPSPPRYRYP